MAFAKYVLDPLARAFQRWYDCSMSLIMDSIWYAMSFSLIFVGYYVLTLFMAPLRTHNLLDLDILIQNVQLYEAEATRFIYAFYIIPVLVILIISIIFGIMQCVITNYLAEREFFENWLFLCLTNALFFFIWIILLFTSIFVIKQSLIGYWLISLVIIFIFLNTYLLALYIVKYDTELNSGVSFFKSLFDYTSLLKSLLLFIISFVLFMILFFGVNFINLFIPFELLGEILLLFCFMIWISYIRLTILEALKVDSI